MRQICERCNRVRTMVKYDYTHCGRCKEVVMAMEIKRSKRRR